MPNETAKNTMTRTLKTISWKESMEEAASLMDDYRIRHLPVTDESNKIIGILSDRDVNRAMNPKRPGFAPGTLVKDFMSWPVSSVEETRSLRDVAEGMVNDKISAVLVTGVNNKVVGIITSEDLLRYLMQVMKDEKTKHLFEFKYTPLMSELLLEASSVGI